MTTHSSILAWRIPWIEETGGPQCCKELNMTEQLTHKEKNQKFEFLLYNSFLDLRIPWTEETGRSMVLQRVGHD